LGNFLNKFSREAGGLAISLGEKKKFNFVREKGTCNFFKANGSKFSKEMCLPKANEPNLL
jgi:hypothetical protein